VIRSGLVEVTGDPDTVVDMVLGAMDRRWRITVGFWEAKTIMVDGKRKKVREVDPVTGRKRDVMVHTVRTLEPFDIDGPTGEEFVTAMDVTPRHESAPAIRRFRVDRATDITVHKRTRYQMPNGYFIGQVRQHASQQASEGWGMVAALTDSALWSIIELASSKDDAIERAESYAAKRDRVSK